MTELIYQALLKTHMIAGLLALPIFWIPALTKKGSPIHRRAGKWFLILMVFVAATGLPLALRFVAIGRFVSGTFLAYLFVITATALATAWYALKFKRDYRQFYGNPYLLVGLVNLLVGATVLYLGLSNGTTLLTLFSFIGIATGVSMFVRKRRIDRGEPDSTWWLQEHLGGMFAAGIAAHVAFGAFGLSRIWPAYASIEGWIGMLPWLAPVVIGTVAISVQTRKYRNMAS
ncbi:MAG: hypothetical protein DHS20C11_24520 [Lysobacteraceae bacterium]|nr:MAG: hypothetical protein DHS20C11_24520 [Xanthomonadaceae bacterium]